jgi:transcriptional regulator with XRE-family HTH domain
VDADVRTGEENDMGKLSQLRSERNLTLNEVCRHVGIPPSRLLEIERGIRIPTSGQIERLEQFYGLKSGALAVPSD